MWYHISEPNSYLAITGGGIETVRIVKKAFVMPWQKVAKISISPFDFSLSLQAMTIEKLQFSLPAVFTIGPDDNREALEKYAVLLSGSADGGAPTTKSGKATSTGRSHVQDIVKGIIEGETRVIVSGMSMEEIFKERQIFKQKVIQNVQSELDQFGLRIYNANVKELQDTPGSEYFAFLSRKAHEGALNQAKVDVAEARMRGEIGEKEKQGRTKQEISKIDAATAVLETERQGEKAAAEAQLATKRTELDMNINLAKIKAKRMAEQRDAELQREVETKRADMELERLRAIDVTKSKIAKETAQQAADATYYSQVKGADGSAYKAQKEADAAYYRKTKEAEAAFFSKKKEAEGIAEMANAYGQLAGVLGGPEGLMRYLMIQDGTYEKLAKANAQAINGLQPKISVWNTGAQGEGSAADASAPIRNLFQSLPPLLSTINEQTGIQPPTWLMQMPQEEQQKLAKQYLTSGKGGAK
ncbi:hypothetical protein FGG08_003510 [Glutinoglossum americanum]|uniref:Band 7 domain-containing protein n=1 Tax=Glutinoglossum americanum TaxID=1670608 RepID=A0A9P8I2H4_9PEZI|nr:hypothetical protein FGG08_003510 [Glutinoglossum americanum]